jgi:hypothetical protein
LGPSVPYQGRNEKQEHIKNFSLVPQFEWHVDLRVFVERREGAGIVESLHKLVLLHPPVSQPDIKRLPFLLWYVNFPTGRAKWGSRNAPGDVADRHIRSYIESADMHVNGGRGYPIKED